jgi:hypothetical protein
MSEECGKACGNTCGKACGKNSASDNRPSDEHALVDAWQALADLSQERQDVLQKWMSDQGTDADGDACKRLKVRINAAVEHLRALGGRPCLSWTR